MENVHLSYFLSMIFHRLAIPFHYKRKMARCNIGKILKTDFGDDCTGVCILECAEMMASRLAASRRRKACLKQTDHLSSFQRKSRLSVGNSS